MKRKVESQLKNIPLDRVMSNPFQPRRNYDEERLKELGVSIKKYGIIQPVVVRKSREIYELVSGERRVRASRIAGLTDIPAIVGVYSDAEMLEIGILENIQRENLSLLEEAKGFSSLLSFMQPSTQKELAAIVSKRLGKKEEEVLEKLSILDYIPLLQKALEMGLITFEHAKLLHGIDKKAYQPKVLEKVITENLSVKETDALICDMQNSSLHRPTDIRSSPSGSSIAPADREVFALFRHILEDAVDALRELGIFARIETSGEPPFKITITLL